MQSQMRLPSCIPNRDEVRLLLSLCRNPMLMLALRLMYFCGLRQGDALGLKAGDVIAEAMVRSATPKGTGASSSSLT